MTLTPEQLKFAKSKWREVKRKTNKGERLDVNGNVILFKLSFEDWIDIWLTSGHWFERGRNAGQYCMSRINDIGHYEVGNVFIQLHAQNTRDANKNYSHERRVETATRPEVRLKNSLAQLEAQNRPETQRKKALGMAKPEAKAKMSKALSRPCTIDGITIYPSVKALVKALGSGKNGSRSPNFRYATLPEPDDM